VITANNYPVTSELAVNDWNLRERKEIYVYVFGV
jgi:hypothetical protein